MYKIVRYHLYSTFDFQKCRRSTNRRKDSFVPIGPNIRVRSRRLKILPKLGERGNRVAHAPRAVALSDSPPSIIAVSWEVSSDGVVNPVKSHRSVRDGDRVKMSGGMPELGSKISLISKADIRYEGRLFTVDPQECTIALANGEQTRIQDGVPGRAASAMHDSPPTPPKNYYPRFVSRFARERLVSVSRCIIISPISIARYVSLN